MNRIATDVEELTGLLFLETVPLNRLQDFASESSLDQSEAKMLDILSVLGTQFT